MTCKDCIHSGLCYKENDYENFPDRCGSFIPARPQAQGEWIFADLHNGKMWYKCSVCGRQVHILHKEQLSNFPFCHCGAKMKGSGQNV